MRRIYLAYSEEDARWIVDHQRELHGEILYSGILPHLIFRRAGLKARDIADYFLRLDFTAITSEAATMHRALGQSFREAARTLGAISPYCDIDLVDCCFHYIYSFLLEAVVSARLAETVLREYTPDEVYVETRPLAPVTRYGTHVPHSNFENQVWSAWRHPAFRVLPLGGGLQRSVRRAILDRVPAERIEYLRRHPFRALGVLGRKGAGKVRQLLPDWERGTRLAHRESGSVCGDLLLILNASYFVENFSPLVHALAQNFRLRTLDLTERANRLWVGVPGEADPVRIPTAAVRTGSRITPEMEHRLLDHPLLVASLADSCVDLLRILKPRLQFMIREDLAYVRGWIDRGAWALKQVRPKLAILAEIASFHSVSVAAVARREGIPTLVLAHGSPPSLLFDSSGRLRSDLYESSQIYGDVRADHHAVWSTYAQEYYVKGLGIAPERVHLTGWPVAERWVQSAASREPRPKSGGEGLRFLFLGPPAKKFPYRLYEAVFEAARKYGARLTLRPHSGDALAGVKELAQRLGVLLDLDNSRPLEQQVTESDLVMGTYTTVLACAIAFHKPTIYLSFPGPRDILPFALEGVAEGVYAPDELVPAIERTLRDPQVQRRQQERADAFIREYMGPSDGRAAERLIGVIRGILRSSQELSPPLAAGVAWTPERIRRRRPVSLGIVGCGAVTELCHLPAARQVPEVRVTALVDTNLWRTKQLAGQFGVTDATTDYRSLMGAVDAVLLAVPNHLHAPMAMEFLQQGVPVMVEKPVARSAAEAETMLAASRLRDVPLQVGLMYRHARGGRFLHRVLKERWLGTVSSIDVEYGAPQEEWPNQSGFFAQRALSGGGALLDYGSHLIDLLVGWLGMPIGWDYEDDARGGIEADARLTLTFNTDGKRLQVPVTMSRLRRLGNRVRIQGDSWSLEYNLETAAGLKLTRHEGVIPSPPFESLPAEEFGQTFGDLYVHQLQAFASVVQRRAAADDSASRSVEILRIIEDCYAKRRGALPPWEVYDAPRIALSTRSVS